MIACIHTVNVLMIEREYKTTGQFTVEKLPANRERKEIYTERSFFCCWLFSNFADFWTKNNEIPEKKSTKFMKKEQFTICEMLAICLTFSVWFCSLFWFFFFLQYALSKYAHCTRHEREPLCKWRFVCVLLGFGFIFSFR